MAEKKYRVTRTPFYTDLRGNRHDLTEVRVGDVFKVSAIRKADAQGDLFGAVERTGHTFHVARRVLKRIDKPVKARKADRIKPGVLIDLLVEVEFERLNAEMLASLAVQRSK